MKILAVGDIVGNVGIEMLKENLQKIKEKNNIDFVIVNGENAADGMGLTEKLYRQILNLGTDVVTMGNHTWAKQDIFRFINDDKIVRPANYSNNNPGKGYGIYDCNITNTNNNANINISNNINNNISNKANNIKNENIKLKKIAVINLIGRVTMNVLSENPFLVAKKIINKVKDKADIIVIDFHGEATAEKIAFANYVDGEATIVFGTHTHVQTADEQIFTNGTAFISDIGMTGPKYSVIGMDLKASIKRFETSLPERYKVATGKGILNACIFEINDETNKVERIERIII